MITPFIILLRAVLVLALLGTGTVPQGMMRATTGDGLRMVICTDGGLREILVTPDGTVTPVDPHPENQTDDTAMSCLVVSPAMPDHDLSHGIPSLDTVRDAALVLCTVLNLPPAAALPGARPRAPPPVV